MHIEPKLVDEIYESLINSFFANGALTDEDLKLSNVELIKKVLKILKQGTNLTVDYRTSILNKADEYYKLREYEYAKIFYAMYFEHSLNSMIDLECQRKSISAKIKNDIIRSVDLNGKLTWLPIIFGHSAFNLKYVKIIKKVADDRNAFIHYKWNPKPEEETIDETKLILEFKSIKLAVRYVKYYESIFSYKKKKAHIISKLKSSKSVNL